MDKEARVKTIAEAISKVASADIGSFCNIVEKKGNRMVVVENSGETGKVLISLQGELEEAEINKLSELIKSVGGDDLQLSAVLNVDDAPEIVDKMVVILAGTEDADIDIELVVE